MIEISGLTNHWLTECEAKEKFQQCSLCKEAILKNQFDSHVASGGCQGQQLQQGGGGGEVNSAESARCPLCHQDILVGDEVWAVTHTCMHACHTHNRKLTRSVNDIYPG